jgi:hypothetical protein
MDDRWQRRRPIAIWTGQNTRDMDWDGGDLMLTARVEFSGKHGTALLRWRKL